MVKECTKCHGVFESDQFYRNKKTSDKLSSWCKKCSNKDTIERDRRRRETDPEYAERRRDYGVNYQYQKRQAAGMREWKPRNTICSIITTHHELTKNDPERLSSDFLISLLNKEI